MRFFGILSPNFGYDPSWEELIALIILTSQFLCVDHSFQTFTRLRWISKNNNFYCSNRLLAHFLYERNNFEGTSIETKRCLHCRGKTMKKEWMRLWTQSFSNLLARRLKMLSRPIGFDLYIQLDVDFLSTFQQKDTNFEVTLPPFRAKPKQSQSRALYAVFRLSSLFCYFEHFRLGISHYCEFWLHLIFFILIIT